VHFAQDVLSNHVLICSIILYVGSINAIIVIYSTLCLVHSVIFLHIPITPFSIFLSISVSLSLSPSNYLCLSPSFSPAHKCTQDAWISIINIASHMTLSISQSLIISCTLNQQYYYQPITLYILFLPLLFLPLPFLLLLSPTICHLYTINAYYI
jgi:hypothetical protein